MGLDQLNYNHMVRKQQLKRWNFLYNSFMGGEEYRKGRYLHHYWGENDAPFDAYQRRLDATPLDNHVRTTVDIYRSYIWKNPPSREFGSLEGNPFVESFIYDADRMGQTLDSWMKDTLAWAMTLGELWILVDKPDTPVDNEADALAEDIRAYVTAYTPQSVLDWDYIKTANGSRELVYVKTIEWKTETQVGLREWTPTVIKEHTVNVDELTGEYTTIEKTVEIPNNLRRVPFIRYIPMPDPGYNHGVSMMGDVADIQRSIYNKLSELEQNIRISNHPMLVKTPEAQAQAGAGAIINIPEDTDGSLKPYLLQPSGASIDGIIKAIEKDVEAINHMTHLTAVRAQKNAMSGVALQTERQLLNAKLGDLSDSITELENKIWDMWCEWMDVENNITVTYSHHFDTRDPGYEMELIGKALEAVDDPAFANWAKRELVQLVIRDEDEMNQVLNALSTASNNNNTNINNNDAEFGII